MYDALPEDVHSIIVSYLSLYEVIKLYMPVCSSWMRETTNIMTYVSVNSTYEPIELNITKNLFKLLNNRFPNMVELQLPQVSITYNVFALLLDCSKLQLIRVGKDDFLPALGMNDDRERFLYWKQNIFDFFPDYRAMPVIFTQTFINETKRARNKCIEQDRLECEILRDKNITHITVDFGTTGIVFQTIMELIGNKITHVVINGVRNEENCVEFIKALPDCSNVTYLNMEKQDAKKVDWQSIFQKTPNLTSLSVRTLEERDAELLAKFCPNLTKLSIAETFHEPDPVHIYRTITHHSDIIALEKCKKLKELKVRRLTKPITQDDLCLESLTLRESYNWNESLSKLTFLKQLFYKASSPYSDIIENCHFLEEVMVSEHASVGDIEALVDGIPSLKLIHGAGEILSLFAPMLAGGVIDVKQFRKGMRKVKRRKLE